MGNEKIKYVTVDAPSYPKTGYEQFVQVFRRSIKLELFNGLRIVFMRMVHTLWGKELQTVLYPLEKLPISPRYRAVHKLYRLLESESERCIGCGLCEKICVSKCIRMETHYDENGRKAVSDYTINLGRCIYCGLCAEVCPELAIVHGDRYENTSEQRAHFTLKEDMLTPIDLLKNQKEFDGFGAVSPDANAKIKKTPLAY